MSFNSFNFLFFFLIVVCIYYIIPNRIRYIWLLICSYYFYMSWNAKYVILIMISTIVTYFAARILEYINNLDIKNCKKKNFKIVCMVSSILINFAILFTFKYYNFVSYSIMEVSRRFGINHDFSQLNLLLPVGISFYTFQAIGYTIDVYRGDIYAEKNILKYALFVSFFPQLVAGPIERSKNLLKQLSKEVRPDYLKIRLGFLTMLWGYIIKMVIADRIAVFVTVVYENYEAYHGICLALATVLFAVQIYCDFAGYSYIAMGAARVMGIELMENFNAPYFSKSCSEFWRRWHISLSSWFKDYLYIPLGGNRKGRLRQYINVMITFTVSGLWHVANWTYVVWGMLNGFYQVVENIIKHIKSRYIKTEHSKINFFKPIIKIIITFILVDFSWIFFRAQNVSEAFAITDKIISLNTFRGINAEVFRYTGLYTRDFVILAVFIAILLIFDMLKTKGINCIERIEKSNFLIRQIIYIAGVTAIIIWGMWGNGYDAASFIYFQF